MGLEDKPPCFLSTRSQSSLENCVFWNASLLLGFSDGLMIVRKIKMVRLVDCNSAITFFLCVTIFHILIFNHSLVSLLVFVCQDGVSQSYLGCCGVHREEKRFTVGAEAL